jgi:hypothetical protein
MSRPVGGGGFTALVPRLLNGHGGKLTILSCRLIAKLQMSPTAHAQSDNETKRFNRSRHHDTVFEVVISNH